MNFPISKQEDYVTHDIVIVSLNYPTLQLFVDEVQTPVEDDILALLRVKGDVHVRHI